MNCLQIPGTSQATTEAEVKEVLDNLMDEVVLMGSTASAIDSPSFSTSSFCGENTTTSSEAVTDQENHVNISFFHLLMILRRIQACQ